MRRNVLVCLILAAVTIGAYWQVARCGFVYFDDGHYVAENEVVQRGITLEGLAWAFSTERTPYWQPLAWLSHMLDCQLFGLNVRAHHLVNLLLHVVNSILLLVLMRRMTGDLWPSAFVAGVFALHPLHVESVAWVSERKDVLSTLFWMLALLAYVRYAERRRAGAYVLSVALFALGLMTKPIVVTLPFVLLLLDYWPLRRLPVEAGVTEVEAGTGRFATTPVSRLLLEKVPFLALTLASSALTFVTQRAAGTVVSLESLSIMDRVNNAVIGYGRYLAKTVWPDDLAVIYGHPVNIGVWLWASAGVLLVISIVILRTVRSRPHLLVGWLWFLGTLVPVIGLVQVWHQPIADRFMYIPLIGLSIMVAWSIPAVWSRGRTGRVAISAAGVVVLAACAVLTTLQVRHWRNTLTLFEQAVAATHASPIALNNLAWIYATHPDARVRNAPEAVRLAERLCRLVPDDPSNLDTLATAYAAAGRFDEAAVTARRAGRIAVANGAQDLAIQIAGRLQLYMQRQPYLEPNDLITPADTD